MRKTLLATHVTFMLATLREIIARSRWGSDAMRIFQCPNFPESQAEIKYQISIRNKPKEKELDGQLRVRVIEAKNLPAMDWGGTSDPYIVATFENKTRKTATIFKTLHPVWNELLQFGTKVDEMDHLLQLECFDQDLGSKDGMATFMCVDNRRLKKYEIDAT